MINFLKKLYTRSPTKDYYGGYDCLNKMIEEFGVDAVYYFCICNSFKYRYRCGKKKNNSIFQEIKKASHYDLLAKEIKRGKTRF